MMVMMMTAVMTEALRQHLPPSMVHELAQQLNGRLGAVLLHHGHVQVIYKHDRVLAHWGAVDALAPLVEFAVNDVLQKAYRDNT
jgi:hypothetical protein